MAFKRPTQQKSAGIDFFNPDTAAHITWRATRNAGKAVHVETAMDKEKARIARLVKESFKR